MLRVEGSAQRLLRAGAGVLCGTFDRWLADRLVALFALLALLVLFALLALLLLVRDAPRAGSSSLSSLLVTLRYPSPVPWPSSATVIALVSSVLLMLVMLLLLPCSSSASDGSSIVPVAQPQCTNVVRFAHTQQAHTHTYDIRFAL